MDRSGQVLLGKYQLTRLLGKGGMGEVWEGEHRLTGRRVAVKVLADAYLSNRKVVARFGREARAASSVLHDGIVEIIDQDRTSEGVPFLVMEFLEGETVGQRIKRSRRLSQSEALAIMIPLLDALDAAHRAGVIHRDLKPDNVFILPGVRGEERIKILDFGISQKADEIEHRLTQEGSVLGTPHYMSPEQARGESNIDVRVDVYAAAIMLYECVVGEVPFDASNYNALLQTILSRTPAPPRERGAEISAALEQVIMACLSKRREERPPNVRVFRELLIEASRRAEPATLDSEGWCFRTAPELRAKVAEQTAEVPASNPFELEADLFKTARRSSIGVARSARNFDSRASSPGTQPSSPGLRSESRPSFSSLTLDSEAAARGTSGPSPPIELAHAPGRPQQITARAVPRALKNPPRRPQRAEPGRVRAVFRFLAMLAALALLVYVGQAVFKRPDPRRPRAPVEAEPDPSPSPSPGPSTP